MRIERMTVAGSQADEEIRQRVALPHAIRLAMMMGAFRQSRALSVAAALGIAERLRAGPLTADELARRCGTDGRCLYRLLRALASAGFFQEGGAEEFGLTRLGSMLLPGPDSVLPTVLDLGGERHWRLWGELFNSVWTGEPAWPRLFGQDFLASCDADPNLGRAVMQSKTAIYAPSDDAIVATYPFDAGRHILEVGLAGGYGGLLAKVLARWPEAHGTLFDLPCVVAGAGERLRTLGLEGRFSMVGGDCREGVPVRADLCVLKGVLHNLDDDAAVTVLRHCRNAVQPHGVLVIAEMLMPPGNEFFVGKMIDLEDLLLTQHGRERSEAEIRRLVAAAELCVTGVVATSAPISLVEARPV
jgi:hypothetical protein